MIKANFSVILVLGFWSLSLHAELGPKGEVIENRKTINFEIDTCPKDSPEVLELMGQLTDLRGELAKEEACSSVVENLDGVENFLSSEKSEQTKRFTDLTNLHRGQMLTVKETEEVRNYAAEVSRRVTGLISAINSDGKCLKEEETKVKLVNRASGIILSITQSLSQVSGPYGVPIALGGSLAAGLLQGIGEFQKNKKGLDYQENGEHLELYARSLCTYHELRKQVTMLLDPKDHLAGLKKIETHLGNISSDLRAKCVECKEIQGLFEQYEAGLNLTDALSAEYISELKKKVDAADKKYEGDPGSNFLLALRKIKFVNKEISEVDVGRKFPGHSTLVVTQTKNQMDYWFFQQEASEFINWYVKEARRIARAFRDTYLSSIYSLPRRMWDKFNLYQNPEALDRSLYAPLYSFSDFQVFRFQAEDSYKQFLRDKSYSESSQASQLDALSNLGDEFDVVVNITQDYCSFFVKAGVSFPNTEEQCLDPMVTIPEGKEKSDELSRGLDVPFRSHPETRGAVVESVPRAKDWLQAIDSQLADPNP